MNNRDKLIPVSRQIVRTSIIQFGTWSGIVKYQAEDRILLRYATLYNVTALHDLLEFYNLS